MRRTTSSDHHRITPASLYATPSHTTASLLYETGSFNQWSWRRLSIVLGWIVLGCCCLPIDVRISQCLLNGFFPGDVRALFHRAEVFGHAYGALAILATIYILDVPHRKTLWHLSACFLVAGLMADLLKLQVWRMRPRHFIGSGMEGSTFLGTIWHTMEPEWLTILDHAHQSFPSAHTAGAVAMAASLGRVYPAGRSWFFVLAGLCAMNRIDGGAHYLSDVCWGAALGYLVFVLMPTADCLSAWIGRRVFRRPAPSLPKRQQRHAA